MNKFILILFMSFGIHSVCFSQNGWFWQNPLPNGNTLNSVKFINTQIGFAVGNSGTILKTTNAGEDWTMYNSNFTNDIQSLAFPNTNIVFAVGTDGLLIKTMNSGASWETISIGTSDSLNAVYFFNSNIGYIVGNRGKIFITINGGDNWFEQVSGTTSKLNNVYFLNPDKGFICGDYKLLRTTNGGNNWSVSEYGSIFNSISFISDNTGFMAGGFSSTIRDLRRTTNGGTSWLSITLLSGNMLNEIQFINSLTGFLCGNNNTFYKTTNSGTNWISDNTISGDGFALNSVFFHNSTEGYLVGTYGTIFKSANTGNNWTLKSPTGTFETFDQIDFPSQNTGYILGNTIYKTTNGGNNWINTTITYLGIFQMNFQNELTGYLNANYNLFKTTNGSLSWNQLNPSTDSIGHTQFIDANTGFYTHPFGSPGIYKTTNGALNWVFNNISAAYIRDFFFSSSQTGFSIAFTPSKFELISSTNGGQNWFSISPIPEDSLSIGRLYFINNTTGFLSKEQFKSSPDIHTFRIYKTINSGLNWNVVNTTVIPFQSYDYNSNSFKFFNNNVGYVFGRDNLILKTTDQGETWLKYSDHQVNIRDIAFTDKNTGYVVGYGGLIKKTTNGGTIGIENISSIPIGFILHQNYPNPFNPVTKINYELPVSAHVALKVYDILGKEIITLLNEKQVMGSYEIEFNGEDLPSGIYFYKLVSTEFTETRKMVLLK